MSSEASNGATPACMETGECGEPRYQSLHDRIFETLIVVLFLVQTCTFPKKLSFRNKLHSLTHLLTKFVSYLETVLQREQTTLIF
jgi:hypothetical protein